MVSKPEKYEWFWILSLSTFHGKPLKLEQRYQSVDGISHSHKNNSKSVDNPNFNHQKLDSLKKCWFKCWLNFQQSAKTRIKIERAVVKWQHLLSEPVEIVHPTIIRILLIFTSFFQIFIADGDKICIGLFFLLSGDKFWNSSNYRQMTINTVWFIAKRIFSSVCFAWS